MPANLRVAGVGAGFFSEFQYDAWARMPDVDLAAICDLDADRAAAMAVKHGAGSSYTEIAQMLDEVKPDLLDIAVPPAAHFDIISMGAERRIPMICQKPFCATFETAAEAVSLCEAAETPLVVHENFRFQPWYRKIRSVLDEGRLGEIYQASFRLRPGDGQGADAYLDRQPYFQKMERFLVHETAIHLIDTLRYLFGEMRRVYADLRRLNPTISGEDAGIILFDFAAGPRGLFDGNRLSDHAAENRRLTMGELLIEGEKGTLALNGDGAISLRPFGSNAWEELPYEWENTGFGGDCVYALQEHVAAHLAGHGPLENTGLDYLTNLKIEEVVYRSNDEACVVDLDA